ncbi:MAG: FxsA family protein [Nocardioidaceae bacterium]
MPALVMLALFVVLPILEIYVIIQVGQEIGALWTVLLLIFESVLGAWIVKREGGRAWQALNVALNTGRMPGRELADGALILVGGTLLLTPGFVTDFFGFFFVLPFTRPLARKILGWAVGKRIVVRSGFARRRRGVYDIYREDDDPFDRP